MTRKPANHLVLFVSTILASFFTTASIAEAGGNRNSSWGWAKPINKKLGAFYSSNKKTGSVRLLRSRSRHSTYRKPTHTPQPTYKPSTRTLPTYKPPVHQTAVQAQPLYAPSHHSRHVYPQPVYSPPVPQPVYTQLVDSSTVTPSSVSTVITRPQPVTSTLVTKPATNVPKLPPAKLTSDSAAKPAPVSSERVWADATRIVE